ncbi:MMPL family transporter [Actinomadura chibensis]|uniref:MMPL family transporter n=1 Tax=Actinomadura chibensis TaxID=392828 RepID=A0A5D0N1D0_9ACTN|nr:MMPL family transporter [Actinomadura chibensis]TYB37995.1 MMPL family transporter [Actinomadura chibensis]
MSRAYRFASLPCGRWGKWVVLVLWIVVLGISVPLAGKLTGAQTNEASAWLPKDAESTRVVDASERFVPSDTFPAVVVYHRDGGPLTAADRAKAAADVPRLQAVTGDPKGSAPPRRLAVSVQGPIPAKDGTALETIVNIRVGNDGWDLLGPAVDDYRDIVQKGAPGLDAHVTGPAGYGGDFSNVFSGFDATLLYVTAAIVIGILLLTYRSPILWLAPLLCVGFALMAAEAVIYLLAEHAGLTVNGQAAFILTVLVFGAGTDYALLLIARYREELRRHEDRHEAMAVALHRAGPAIVASGSTVALSMLCLLVATLNSTKSMGPVMAIGVAVALLAMVTLLPALLVICGRWMFWPRRPKFGTDEPTERGVWARVGGVVAVRPRVTWLVTAVVLGALAAGLFGLKTGSLPNKDAFSTGKPDSVTGEEVLGKHFPAGSGSPVQVVAKAGTQDAVAAALARVPDISDVKLAGRNPGQPSGGLVYLEGTLTAPPDSDRGFTAVQRARDAVHAVPGADAEVGGGTAVTLDINHASHRDQNVVIPIVLVVVLIILALLLRAVVAPVVLVATVVLSYAAALGVSALMFHHVFGFAAADPSFPLWSFVFLVALGTDYNIFLMTRVHEESKRVGMRRGALVGLAATGGVITSAGAVLAGTFAALGSLPLVFVAELGFTVAFGVLLDTFVVRSVLVTALNLDVGRRMWWPSALSRAEPAPAAAAPEEPEPAGSRD